MGPDAGATPSLTVTCPGSAEEDPARSHSMECPPAKPRRGRSQKDKLNLTEPDAGTTPSLTVTFPCSAEEYPAGSHSTGCPPAKARRGRPPRNKKKASVIPTVPPSAEETITEPDAVLHRHCSFRFPILLRNNLQGLMPWKVFPQILPEANLRGTSKELTSSTTAVLLTRVRSRGVCPRYGLRYFIKLSKNCNLVLKTST